MHTMKDPVSGTHIVLLTAIEIADSKLSKEIDRIHKRSRISLQSICLDTQKYKTVIDMKSSAEELADTCMTFFKFKNSRPINYFAFVLTENNILIGAARIKENWWTEFEDSYFKLDILGGQIDLKLKDFSLNLFNNYQTRMAFLFKSEERSTYGIAIVRFKQYNESLLESKSKVMKEDITQADCSFDLPELKAVNESNEYTHIFIDDATHSLIVLGLMSRVGKELKQESASPDDSFQIAADEFIRFKLCNLLESDQKYESNGSKKDVASKLEGWLNSAETVDTNIFEKPNSESFVSKNEKFVSLTHPKLNFCEFSFETNLHYFYGILVLRTHTSSIWMILNFRSNNKKNNEMMKHKLIEYKIAQPTSKKDKNPLIDEPQLTVQAMDNECLVVKKEYTEVVDFEVHVNLSLSNGKIIRFEMTDILFYAGYNQNKHSDQPSLKKKP